MSECPDGTCHDMVVKSSYFIKGLCAVLLVSIGAIVTVSLYAMAAEKKQNDKISEIPVIKKDIEHIKSNVKEIKDAIKDIRTQAVTKEDIDRLIKAVKRDNK